jgi:glycolate oxidase
MPNGEILVTGGMKARCIKNVSGINLTKLLVGSEGILGVVTKIRLRCFPKPRARGIAMAVFDQLDDAPATVMEVYQAGILPSGIEILDSSAIMAVNDFKPEIKLPDAEAILLFEVDGNPPSVEYEGQVIQEVAGRRGPISRMGYRPPAHGPVMGRPQCDCRSRSSGSPGRQPGS